MAVIPLTQLKVTSPPRTFIHPQTHTHTSPLCSVLPPTPHLPLLLISPVLLLYPRLSPILNLLLLSPTAYHYSAVLKLISSLSLLPASCCVLMFSSPFLLFSLHRCGFSSCQAGRADCWSEQHQEARRLPGEVQLQ